MKLLKYLFLFVTFYGYTQYCPYLGPDQLLPCGIGSTTLTADLSQCGAGTNPNQTTNYGVSPISYVTQTNTGTQLFMSDDSQQGPFNIGFTFCFFGQTYNQFWVGSNGWISFSPAQPTTFTSATIPSGAGTVPKNCVMGPWQDWHPGLGGQIRYQVQGAAPCRKLVVSWVGVPMFSCTNLQGTFHTVIYESTNVIENYIQSKPNCISWAGGTAVQGIHNLLGNTAVTVPGRNSTQWTAQNDAYRYTPSGPVVTPTLTWYQVGNPNPIGTGPTITVTPPAQGANYTCYFVYPSCNTGWATCNNNGGLGPDTVFVLPGPPNLPQPIINFTNPTCNSYCDGTIDIIPQGGNGVQSISWNGLLPQFNQVGLCSGTYPFTITDVAGCTVSSIVSLVNPPQIIMNPITGEDTICYLSNLETYSVLTMGNGFNYIWESSSNITNGQGTETITTDWSQLPSGFYQDSISLYSTNQNGCFSDTVYFSPFILNVNPTITPIGPFCSYDNCVTLNGVPLNGIFSGDNVNGLQFCPSINNILNNITYAYTQSNCVFDTTITVTVNPEPYITPITPDNEFFELCEGDSIPKIYLTNSNLLGTYEWTLNGDTIYGNPIQYSWDEDGIFVITVFQTSNGCVSQTEQTTITIDECPEELIYIPNTFTPDGNEYNQVWGPVFTSGYDPYRFELFILNRWGEVIWESHNVESKWDGTYGNKMCQDGTYFWIISFGVDGTDERKQIHGHLTIVR